jgi:iron complex outermembrane receptor protein
VSIPPPMFPLPTRCDRARGPRPALLLWIVALLVVPVAAQQSGGVSGDGSDPGGDVQGEGESFTDLTDLGLEELLDVEVSLVTRRKQRLADAPGSISVLTAEDIERSGMTSIPELLRLVPGVTVQQLGPAKWAVSVRGFANEFANKLLVQVDGRTVYTLDFSGVYWDMQDLVLADIERIEVIRGPGGARWGSNAVNGVINIVTKTADRTRGAYTNTIVGTEDRRIFSARYGFAIDENTDARVSAKVRERGPTEGPDDESVGDRHESATIDLRIDHRISESSRWTVRGGMTTLDQRNLTTLPSLSAPYEQIGLQPTYATGWNLLGRYEVEHEGDARTRVQASYDGYERDIGGVAAVQRHTLEVDVQHELTPWGGNRLTFGGGYRLSVDDFESGPWVTWTDPVQSNDFISLFVLDEIELVEDRLRLNLGLKAEHNDFTGLEWQPEARLAWSPEEETLVWAAVSRAVRTPSRVEDSGVYQPDAQDSGMGGLAAVAQISGNSGLGAENLWAYELGARTRLTSTMLIDIGGFVFDYEDLNEFVPGTPFAVATTPPSITQPLSQLNTGSQLSYGGEASLTWLPTESFRLTLAYAYLQENYTGQPSAIQGAGVYDTAEHRGLLRAFWRFHDDWDVGVFSSYTSDVRRTEVGDWARLDLSLGWRVAENAQFRLVGQNLVQDRHQEAPLGFYSVPTEVERGVYLEFRANF